MKRILLIAALSLTGALFVIAQSACAPAAPNANQNAGVAQQNAGAAQPIASPSAAPDRNFDELAHRIVTTSANVQPGEVVVVTGGKHTVPLMEAIAIEAQKTGALVTMFLESDKVLRSFNADVPDKYLEQEPRYFAEWLKQVDVLITLPGASDIKALNEGVSAERLGKINKAGEFMTPMFDAMKFREIDIVYPTEERGKSFRLDGPTYVKMVWDAMDADYKQISERGNALRQKLVSAKKVHVTSPSGTDVTFETAGRPVTVNDGVVSADEAKSKKFLDRNVQLPSGSISFAPAEASANGKVVVPLATCRFESMTNISFEFKSGKMENLQAGQGKDCFDQLMATSDGPKDMFAGFSLGLNPAWKSHTENGAAYFPGPGAGLVFLSIGDNQLLGGSNKTKGNLGFTFPIANATVWIDDQKVVENGNLL
jgi:leucyl aminopeptidase (aminopeptidase T)